MKKCFPVKETYQKIYFAENVHSGTHFVCCLCRNAAYALSKRTSAVLRPVR